MGLLTLLLCSVPAENSVVSPAVFVLFTLLSRFAEHDKPASMKQENRTCDARGPEGMVFPGGPLVIFHDIEPLKMVFHDLKLFFEERVLGNRISWVEAPQDRTQRRGHAVGEASRLSMSFCACSASSSVRRTIRDARLRPEGALSPSTIATPACLCRITPRAECPGPQSRSRAVSPGQLLSGGPGSRRRHRSIRKGVAFHSGGRAHPCAIQLAVARQAQHQGGRRKGNPAHLGTPGRRGG